jgi:hypothetical protein
MVYAKCISYILLFGKSVQQRVFRQQHMFCTFRFRFVHLPLETLVAGVVVFIDLVVGIVVSVVLAFVAVVVVLLVVFAAVFDVVLDGVFVVLLVSSLNYLLVED